MSVITQHLRHLNNKWAIKQWLRQASSWDLVSSVCLERMPVVIRDLSELEQKFQTLQSNVEFECSLKSDHEIRKEREKVILERIKKGQVNDADIEQSMQATAQDMEDAAVDELAKFTLAGRQVDSSNTHTLHRKLDERLLLLNQQKFGTKAWWILPQEKRVEGETLRQAAERALRKACGETVQVAFLGNAPWGFYKYKYPKSERREAEGAKVFFFKAVYQSGDIQGKNLQWLTVDEAANSTHPGYFKSVRQFLWDEFKPDNK